MLTYVGHNLQDKLHEAIVDLSRGQVESIVRLGPEHHGSSDGEEVIQIEKIALEDEGVKAEIAKLQLPPGTVVISDPWIYGRGPLLTCLCLSIYNLRRVGRRP